MRQKTITLNHSSKNPFSLFDKNSTPSNVYGKLNLLSKSITLLAILIGFQFSAAAEWKAHAVNLTVQDTLPKKDTLRYPIKDRYSDKYTQPGKNPFDLKDPTNIRDSIVYDPKTKEYYIIEKIGSKYFRKPTSLTFDEYMRIQARKMEVDYFQKRSNRHLDYRQYGGSLL